MAPTLRDDGSVLDREGYDVQSGLYADFGGVEYPQLAAAPSLEEAREALLVLDDLLSECAFVGGAQSPSASAMRAAIITALVRRALDTAPALAVTAKQASSGKTALAHIVSRILTGCEAAVIPLDQEAAELGRRLLGVLMAGDPVVCLDNAVDPVDSAALCAALTSGSYQDRIIRSSTMARVSTAVTMIITGNGLRLVGDLTTRALGCALDTGLDRPQERVYQRDIAAFITEHRAQLVRAALTIPLSYLAAGAPTLAVRPSRFHQWDRLVRYPLIWLGCADPIETQSALEDADPEREALRLLLAAWTATCGERGVTVAALMRAAAQKEGMALREALLGVGSDGAGRLNALRVGNYLAERVGQVVDGLQISDAGRDRHTKTRCYRVMTGAAPVSG
jgi:putative DNA primase/helicase